LQALIDAHDDVAAKNYEVVPPDIPFNSSHDVTAQTPAVFTLQDSTDAIRMVGIRKNPDESLVRRLNTKLNVPNFLYLLLFDCSIGNVCTDNSEFVVYISVLS